MILIYICLIFFIIGCITSAESILIEQQSNAQLYKIFKLVFLFFLNQYILANTLWNGDMLIYLIPRVDQITLFLMIFSQVWSWRDVNLHPFQRRKGKGTCCGIIIHALVFLVGRIRIIFSLEPFVPHRESSSKISAYCLPFRVSCFGGVDELTNPHWRTHWHPIVLVLRYSLLYRYTAW